MSRLLIGFSTSTPHRTCLLKNHMLGTFTVMDLLLFEFVMVVFQFEFVLLKLNVFQMCAGL